MMEDQNDVKKEIRIRLRRVEGQVKGIEKMVDEGNSSCKEILIQIAAVRAATNKIGSLILENYAKSCVDSNINSCEDKSTIEELISTINLFLK